VTAAVEISLSPQLPAGAPAAELTNVVVRRGGTTLLGPLDWTVRAGERWAVLGANGAGKTTLLQLCAGAMSPDSGSVALLGEPLDDDLTDLDALLPRVGWSSAALADQLPRDCAVRDVVLTALHAGLRRGGERYDAMDESRAQLMLARTGCRQFADRSLGSLSEGERKRVQLARALMPDPELLLLDEPAAGLDLGGREALLRMLARLAADPEAPALVVVSHHVEELPAGMTHALLLRDGQVVAAGPLDEVMTSRSLTATFGVPLVLTGHGGRFFARTMLPRVS
jgi:iron complex transport system ATP-binding protein